MFQPDLFKGRTILITGGGTGLGRSMALRFAELGAKIFLAARRPEPLEETSKEIRAKGGQAAFALCDVRDFAPSKKQSRPRKKNLAAWIRW
jgi:NAD(P)-dependent dehydrogenase (short-subunit alcohol dehydrogenase family)